MLIILYFVVKWNYFLLILFFIKIFFLFSFGYGQKKTAFFRGGYTLNIF